MSSSTASAAIKTTIVPGTATPGRDLIRRGVLRYMGEIGSLK